MCNLDNVFSVNTTQMSTPTKQLSNSLRQSTTLNQSPEKGQKAAQFFKKGKIYKKGDGPINYSWNERYAILDGMNFIYFDSEISMQTPKKTIFLNGAKVEVAHDSDRIDCFSLEIEGKVYYFSGINTQDNEEWLYLLQKCVKEGGKEYLNFQEDINGFGELGKEEQEEEDDKQKNGDEVEVPKNIHKEIQELDSVLPEGSELSFVGQTNGVRIFGKLDDDFEAQMIKLEASKPKIGLAHRFKELKKDKSKFFFLGVRLIEQKNWQV